MKLRENKFIDKMLFGTSSKNLSNLPSVDMALPTWTIGSPIDIKRLRLDVAKVEWKNSKLDNGLINNKILINSMIFIFFIWGIFSIWLSLFVLGEVEYLFLFLGLPFLGFMGLYNLRRDIKVDLFKYQVAKKYFWTYDPTPSKPEAEVFKKKFPYFFPKSTKPLRDVVDDQLWGSFSQNGLKRSFHSGVYVYSKAQGRSSKEVNFNFFALQLNKKISIPFTLVPEFEKFMFTKKFSKKELNLESIAFNKVFFFEYDGSKDDVSLCATKVLSPVVQNMLVDIAKDYVGLRVAFLDDIIMFGFDSSRDFIFYDKSTSKTKSVFDYESFIFRLNKITTEVASRLE